MSLLLPAARRLMSLAPSAVPRRQRRLAGLRATVDGIPFTMPVNSERTPALMAAFPVDREGAARLLPGGELHPVRLPGGRGLLVVTVVNYEVTDIGKYVEYSLAIACTFGPRPAPPLVPGLLRGRYGTGQFVVDLPVSSEVSVKGGKGIWGMPKHQANLDYVIGESVVSSQYDQDGMFAVKIEVQRPEKCWVPVRMQGANYSGFRGMLFRSTVFFHGKLGFHLLKKGSAKLWIGEHPRVQPLKDLDISPDPLFAAFLPQANGVLDDHIESWFLSEPALPVSAPEGMEAVVSLGQSQEWLAPPVPISNQVSELVRR